MKDLRGWRKSWQVTVDLDENWWMELGGGERGEDRSRGWDVIGGGTRD